MNPWSMMSSNLSLNLGHLHDNDTYQTRGDSRYSNYYNGYPIHPIKESEQKGNWLMPPPLQLYLPGHAAHLRELMPESRVVHSQVVKPTDGNCKLFGIPLFSKPASVVEPAVSCGDKMIEAGDRILGLQSNQSLICESDKKSELFEVAKVLANPQANSEQEKASHTFQPLVNECLGKVQGGSVRSCTKVHKQGIALGRSVDLAKFNNYDELITELDHLFEFNGELKARNNNWLVVYTDNEDDMMLVGDDPWGEFCGMVHKIFIYTRDEVQRMNPGTLNSKGEEEVSLAAEDTKILLPFIHSQGFIGEHMVLTSEKAMLSDIAVS